MLFLTVPTAGQYPSLLTGILEKSGIPGERSVIIRTDNSARVPGGTLVIDDFDTPNIQRWWKRGIDEAVSRGATAVAVLNDDLTLDAHTIPTLHDALVSTGATIASPSRRGLKLGVHKTPLIPYSPVIWGCLWMLDVTTDLRPDPRYVWWYGDNDLDIRARRDYSGIVSCNVNFQHHFPGQGTAKCPLLVRQTDQDARTFQSDYARLLTLSRWITKLMPFANVSRARRST